MFDSNLVQNDIFTKPEGVYILSFFQLIYKNIVILQPSNEYSEWTVLVYMLIQWIDGPQNVKLTMAYTPAGPVLALFLKSLISAATCQPMSQSTWMP
jgi:hypothetical protein